MIERGVLEDPEATLADHLHRVVSDDHLADESKYELGYLAIALQLRNLFTSKLIFTTREDRAAYLRWKE